MTVHFRDAQRAVAIRTAADRALAAQNPQAPVSAQPAEPEREQSEVRPEHGWWPRSISDGDCHYGLLNLQGVVEAACGLSFVPDKNPFLQKAVRQHSPADKEHACPACRKLHPQSAD